MNVLNTQRRLLLGSAVGALALRPSRTVKADTTFTNFSFAATGAPAGVKRTLPDRLAEIINVKDWGALGNNSNDDSGPIQNAVNQAMTQGGGKVEFAARALPCRIQERLMVQTAARFRKL
jgi:polygalacturonase